MRNFVEVSCCAHTFPKYPILELVPWGPQVATGRGRVPGWLSGFDISPVSDMPFGRGILANLGQESFCFCFPSSTCRFTQGRCCSIPVLRCSAALSTVKWWWGQSQVTDHWSLNLEKHLSKCFIPSFFKKTLMINFGLAPKLHYFQQVFYEHN